MPKQDGGPAFATSGVNDEFAQDGMSLRDYFAGQALTGLLSNPSYVGYVNSDGPKLIAQAYRAADLMLEAREAK